MSQTKSKQGDKTGLLAGFRFETSCFRFGGDFCRLDMQELFHGTARVALRHRKISDVVAQAVGIQSINVVSRSKIFRCVQQFLPPLKTQGHNSDYNWNTIPF